MTAKIRVAGIVLSLLVLAGLILLLARPRLDPARIQPIILVGAAWIVFGCAAWLVRKVAVRLAVALILAGGIAVQVVALTGPPQNSSDLYRYIWDGRVQAAGIDPYLYPPADAGVAKLRNDFLWSGTGAHRYVDCVPSRVNKIDPADSFVAGCTKLNRPRVPTVYPPVAEAYFFALQMAAPADNSTTPVQAAAAAFAIAVTFILLFGLRKLGKDLRLVALWAWCPTVALEAGQNGHVDVVGVALAAVALFLLARAKTKGRTILGGVLIGMAIATKVTPVLVVPAVLRRGWFLIPAAVVATISLVYVPHVIAVGSKIIGFFPGYLNQEGYSTGSGFSVIGLFVHGKVALLVAVVILGAIALAILRFGNPDEPWHGGMLMTAAALAVTTPDFQWYAILLVMLVALDGRPEWLMIAAGGYLANSPGLVVGGFALHSHQERLLGYGGGAAIACALALVRYFLTRRAAMAAESGAAAEQAVAEVTGSDADSVADAAAVSGEALAAEPASGSAPTDVVEPTAIYPKSAVSVIIGVNGTPEFASDDDKATSPDSAPGRFHRLIR
ncbi:MAG TPA: glycosyltransferase 87 family protein [Trebonia sp.]